MCGLGVPSFGLDDEPASDRAPNNHAPARASKQAAAKQAAAESTAAESLRLEAMLALRRPESRTTADDASTCSAGAAEPTHGSEPTAGLEPSGDSNPGPLAPTAGSSQPASVDDDEVANAPSGAGGSGEGERDEQAALKALYSQVIFFRPPHPFLPYVAPHSFPYLKFERSTRSWGSARAGRRSAGGARASSGGGASSAMPKSWGRWIWRHRRRRLFNVRAC